MNAIEQVKQGFMNLLQKVGDTPFGKTFYNLGVQASGGQKLLSPVPEQSQQTGWYPAPAGDGYYPSYDKNPPFKYLPDPTPQPNTPSVQTPRPPVVAGIQEPSSPAPSQAGFRLAVPGRGGAETVFPSDIAQQIGQYFDPYNEATSAARVLLHPMQQTRTSEEIKRLGPNVNMGENPQLIVNNVDMPNDDGSIDRGLFRINSNTYNDMVQKPFWRQAMLSRGINSWDDLNDLNKNVQMALLILKYKNWSPANNDMSANPNYRDWYAAPLDLRTR